MQKFVLIIAILCINGGILSAQNVIEEEKAMSLGKQMAFQVDIDGADEDMTEDVWKDYIKNYGKSKRNKKAREYYSMGAQVPIINGADQIDLYIRFDEKVGMTAVSMWVDLGNGFVNTNEFPRAAQGSKEFLTNFYLAVKKEAISEEMKEQEKTLKNLDKELNKLENKNSDYHEDIEKAKRKIEEAERNIEQNLKEQEDQRILIAQQKRVIEEIIERLNNLGRN